MKQKNRETYTVLAKVYDTLMADVDYEAWADFIDEIIQTHHPNPIEIMELACGTGAVALSLSELDCYTISASDKSAEMIEIAKQKADEEGHNIQFSVMDFAHIHSNKLFDVVFTVFDSVNYLHSHSQILEMLNGVQKILKPGGLFIFDFSTPQNSIEAVDYLNNDEGGFKNYRFFRESKYEPSEQMHYNIFDIEKLSDDGKIVGNYREIHKQRIYSLQEMLSIVRQTSYHLIAKYEDFELVDANENSTRITMVMNVRNSGN